MNNKINLGQYFTNEKFVNLMLSLIKNNGSKLEPSCGDGSFFNKISNCIGIEYDKNICPLNAINMDFFDYSIENKFDTIIGNPPYVKFNDIIDETKLKLDLTLFDKRSNLYLFFINKCLEHLNHNGELIFITPRDFIKFTSATKLNEKIYNLGTITDIIDLGDDKFSSEASPNLLIWRFEKDNFTRKTNDKLNFWINDGQIMFTEKEYKIKFNDLFYIKVGGVSGMDKIFEHPNGQEFIYSETCKTGKLKKMIYNKHYEYLNNYKIELLNRKIKKFNENNWWMWGRNCYQSNKPRIYVNCKTRNKKPFFINECKLYDGTIFAIFPKDENIDLEYWKDYLNNVDWDELGFMCNGRYLFTQKSLENTYI